MAHLFRVRGQRLTTEIVKVSVCDSVDHDASGFVRLCRAALARSEIILDAEVPLSLPTTMLVKSLDRPEP